MVNKFCVLQVRTHTNVCACVCVCVCVYMYIYRLAPKSVDLIVQYVSSSVK
jgi:hypothetical protein